jgi:hypothetical protein
MRKSLLVVTWTIWAIVFGVTGYLLTRVEYISDNESATVAAVYLLVLVLSFLTLAYITVPWRVPTKTVLVMEDTGVSSGSRNKLAGLSLIAVVIILAINLGLGTAIFGGKEPANRGNAGRLGGIDSSWRSTGSEPLNPIQVALSAEERYGLDELRLTHKGSIGFGWVGDPSYTLRAWSAMLAFGGAINLASAFLWRKFARRAPLNERIDLTYLMAGFAVVLFLSFVLSLLIIQELDSLAPGPVTSEEELGYYIANVQMLQMLVTSYEALLYFGSGVLLVLACFTLATGTWYSGGESLAIRVIGAALAVSVVYYIGFFGFASAWLFLIAGVAALILLIHAGWQTYRGVQFLSQTDQGDQ